MNEAKITINGVKCTDAMVMAICVAIESFDMDLVEDGLGDDEHGLRVVKLYRQRIREIRSLLFRNN